NERARRGGRADRPKRDTKGSASASVGRLHPGRRANRKGSYACRRSAGAAADAGSIPAASILPANRDLASGTIAAQRGRAESLSASLLSWISASLRSRLAGSTALSTGFAGFPRVT